MRNEPNRKMIGLFMASGLAVLIIIFGLFVKSKFFAGDGKVLVMYFEESINGLNVGSPVVFKGVQIGKVASIELIANAEDLSFSIPVYVKMDAEQSINHSETYGEKEMILNALIAKGLRARLTTQSYLTGQLMIELEMLPDTPVVLKNLNPGKRYFEIPTALSAKEALSQGFQRLPFKQSLEKFNTLIDELNTQMPVLLPQINKTFKDIDKVVTSNSRASSDALDNFNKAAVNVSEAAKSIRNLTDYLERHPEALLKGKRGN